MLGEGGVHPDLRTGVDDAHAFRPDEPHPEGPGELDQIAIGARRWRCPLIRLARGEHDEAADPLHPAFAHSLGHPVSRHSEHRQFDGAGNLGHTAIRAQTSDRVGLAD